MSFVCDLHKDLGLPPDRRKDHLSHGMQRLDLESTVCQIVRSDHEGAVCGHHLEFAGGGGWAGGVFVDETALFPVARPCRQRFLASALKCSSLHTCTAQRPSTRLMRILSSGALVDLD